MAYTFAPVPLFGGAITSNIPQSWIDVSNLREIPDNQEVYLDMGGFSSVIFEINERVCDGESDEKAIDFHIEDIIGEDAWKKWEQKQFEATRLPSGTPVHTTLFTTKVNLEASRGVSEQTQYVAAIVTVIRLVQQKTDIIININLPHSEQEAAAEKSICAPDEISLKGLEKGDWDSSKAGALLQNGMKLTEEILKSFEILDWELFGSD